jgi:molybdopterin synthase sulfur carrier subunit
VTLLYLLGLSKERLELPPGVRTLRDLAEHLRARGGPFGDVFSNLGLIRAAVDQMHASWDAPIENVGEVAIFPPVTGG